MLAYMYGNSALRAINTSQKSGEKLYSKDIFGGWETVSKKIKIQFGKCILNSLIFPQLQ